jgi:hypothetical protein
MKNDDHAYLTDRDNADDGATAVSRIARRISEPGKARRRFADFIRKQQAAGTVCVTGFRSGS